MLLGQRCLPVHSSARTACAARRQQRRAAVVTPVGARRAQPCGARRAAPRPASHPRSIQFGGAGIFGACKNIDISEINGFVTVRGEPGELAPDGSVRRPARLLVQLEGPGGHK